MQSAKAALEKAASAVRDSRGTVNKRLQDMQKKKIARPDDVRKAQDQMEKITEKAQKEVKDLFETAKKALERAWFVMLCALGSLNVAYIAHDNTNDWDEGIRHFV